MEAYLFKSVRDRDVFAFTSDKEGCNLPAEFAPWERQAGTFMSAGAASISDEALRAMREHGYFVGYAGVTVSRHSPG